MHSPDDDRGSYQALFEAIDDGFCIVEILLDPSGQPADYRFIAGNAAFARATGLQNAIGKTALELIPGLERWWIETYGRVALSRTPERFENHSVPMGRWFEVYAFPFGARERHQVAIFFRNITERKAVEEQLRKSEATLNAVLDALPVGVVIADPTGRIVRDNEANRAIWGLPADVTRPEQYGQWVGYWPETGKRIAMHEWAMARALHEGEIVRGELVECERFGTKQRRMLINAAAPVRNAEGQIIAGVAAELDVTERLAAERALRDNEKRLRLAGEAAGVGFWSWSIASDIIVLDSVCGTLFGLPPEIRTRASDVLDVVHPGDRDLVRAAFRRALLDGERYEVEFRVLLAGDSTRWLAGLGNVVRVDDRPMQLTGVYWDITARKRAEADRAVLLESERAARGDAERASALKDEFLATVSHELRTPLTSILGWAQLLAVSGSDPERLAEGLSVIERNARAQACLIEDLLDMSRIISGKIGLEDHLVDLHEVVSAAFDAIRPHAEAKRVRIERPLAAPVGLVRGDTNRIQQVLSNLLRNAVKFTPVDGRVSVRLEQVTSVVRITVTDTGQGIDPAFLPYVFDQFRQGDGSTTRRQGGLGLGLAIVRQLVELHGGRVWASSEGRDRGATFVVELPVAQAERSPAAQQPGAQDEQVHGGAVLERGSLAGLRVLVVDDEPDMLGLVRRVLEEVGIRVNTASSGGEALDVLQRERTDVLVSDIGMPDVDGYELISRVRATSAGEQLPAIALTAFARFEDQTRALRAGYHAHLTKPVRINELIAVIARLAGRA